MVRGVAVLVALLLLLTAGCGGAPVDTLPDDMVDIAQLGGDGATAISLKGTPITGVVVYFHGMDQFPDVIYKNPNHRALFTPLLRSGYAVVSAEAGGNAFGNPTSLDDYRALAAAAEARYHVGPTLFVAESMGGLAALALYSEDHKGQIKGMVGITPLMGIPADARSIDFVQQAWHGSVPDSADPMEWNPESLSHRNFLLFQADDDTVIPAGATAGDFASRFGSTTTVEVVRCGGGHVDPDCYQPSTLQRWVTGLGH
jgi:predicted alpha/beta hydrolase family esterase